MSATLRARADITDALLGGAGALDAEIHLGPGDCTLRLRSNSDDLIAGLRDYFGHVIVEPRQPDMDVIAVERDAPDLGIEFVDWKREPGKTGRKDSYLDLPGARLVRKVRTGMVFLQSENQRIAAGPCIKYDNQVINFINSQYMNWLQNRGWLICHASGLVKDGRCLAIAGLSGGGKSTLMLRLLGDASVSHLTNDRLFVLNNGETEAVGIPKLPRINPGTIVHNEALHGLMSAEEREEFLSMPADELWHVEDKYDVHVDRVYGKGRIVERAPLASFLVLNWSRESEEKPSVEMVDLRQRRDLLSAIMKSPGPFYQFADGRFFEDTMAVDEETYLTALDGVRIYEATGGVDFDRLCRQCVDGLMGRDG